MSNTKLEEKYQRTCVILLWIRKIEQVAFITALAAPALLILPKTWTTEATLWLWGSALLIAIGADFLRVSYCRKADREHAALEEENQ